MKNIKESSKLPCLILVLFISILYVNETFSQTTEDIVPPINIPTSPEAALMGRFGDIPIGYYTGTANISIPLYVLKEDDIEIPITLSYHSSGIKVEDEATWVGLGWDLSPEGTIIQEVRGKNDEQDWGDYLYRNDPNYLIFRSRFDNILDDYGLLYQIGRTSASGTDFCLNTAMYEIYMNFEGDPLVGINEVREGIRLPDIYSYSFGQYSGKFYFDPMTHLPVLIDRKEQIVFEKTNSDNIKATTLDGTIYNFGVVEKAHGEIINEYTGKTYKLNNIALLNGKNITFNYSESPTVESILSESANINFESHPLPPPITSKYDNVLHTKQSLIQILTSDAIVDFNLEDREDDISNSKKWFYC